uniref:Uncharacterized protein n=1 Tax=Romanomermis culicivorax TaxID=13658 RepID=A0A915IVF2_ROMCU
MNPLQVTRKYSLDFNLKTIAAAEKERNRPVASRLKISESKSIACCLLNFCIIILRMSGMPMTQSSGFLRSRLSLLNERSSSRLVLDVGSYFPHFLSEQSGISKYQSLCSSSPEVMLDFVSRKHLLRGNIYSHSLYQSFPPIPPSRRPSFWKTVRFDRRMASRSVDAASARFLMPKKFPFRCRFVYVIVVLAADHCHMPRRFLTGRYAADQTTAVVVGTTDDSFWFRSWTTIVHQSCRGRVVYGIVNTPRTGTTTTSSQYLKDTNIGSSDKRCIGDPDPKLSDHFVRPGPDILKILDSDPDPKKLILMLIAKS